MRVHGIRLASADRASDGTSDDFVQQSSHDVSRHDFDVRNTMSSIQAEGSDLADGASPWQKSFVHSFDISVDVKGSVDVESPPSGQASKAVPVMEGYLPGAARNSLKLKSNDEQENRRERQASIREGSQRRRESATNAKGETRRFSFMSSPSDFNNLLINHYESEAAEKKAKELQDAIEQDLKQAKDKRERRARNSRGRFSSGTFSQIRSKNPVLATYIDLDAKPCQKTFLYAMVAVGFAFSIAGIVVGAGIIPMVMDSFIRKGIIVTPSSPCFKEGGLCPDSIGNKYFLWNITNPHEYLAGSQAPVLEEVGPYYYKNYQKNYNVEFSRNKTMVDFDYVYFWDYVQSESCEACQNMDAPIYTVNSAYLQVLSMGGGSETAVMMGFLPNIMDGIFQGLQAVVSQVVGSQAEDTSDDLVFSQWANCSVLGASVTTLPFYAEIDPFVPDFCAWHNAYLAGLGVNSSTLETGMPVEVAQRLFGRRPNPNSEDAAAVAAAALDPFPDSTAFIMGVMMMPEDQIAAILAMDANQILMLKGYLFSIVNTYGHGMFSAVLGEPFGAASTGVLIKRSARQLLEGWQDPLLANFMPGMNMSYNVGWHIDDMEAIDAQFSDGTLTNAHPFVFNKLVKTGKYNPKEAGDILDVFGMTSLAFPNGTIDVAGSKSMDPSTGFRFYKSRKQLNVTLFHDTINRPLRFDRAENDAGISTIFGIDALHFPLGADQQATCAADEAQCVYSNGLDGAWNISSIYMAPSLGSLPQWRDPRHGDEGPQLVYDPSNKRDFALDIEPRIGSMLRLAVPFQFNYLVPPTDVFHSDIWVPHAGSDEGAGAGASSHEPGLYLPTFYYDLQAEIKENDAYKLRRILNLIQVLVLSSLVGLPLVGVTMMVYGVYNLYFSADAYKMREKTDSLERSRASTLVLTKAGNLSRTSSASDIMGRPLASEILSRRNSKSISRSPSISRQTSLEKFKSVGEP